MTLSSPPAPNLAEQRKASLMLICGTVFWGCSFTWVKSADELANLRLGFTTASSAGPIFILGWRFTVAALAWFAIFPASRVHWSWRSVGNAVVISIPLIVGLIFQVLSLLWATPAVSAFLTALTVLFVPLLATIRYFRSPSPLLWVGVAMATLGIWLMTGATPAGFGLGEWLGLACSVTFAFYILAVNAIVPKDNPFRMTGASLLITGVVCMIVSAIQVRGLHVNALASGPLILRLALLIPLSTVAAYGILTIFQPKIDPTRAALLYLFEPVFAAIYDYAEVGRKLTPIAIVGATLIIAANVLVELLGRTKRDETSA